MVSTCLQRRTHWTFGLQIAQCPWRCTLDLCTWLHCTLHSLRQTDFFVSNVEETSNTWWANGRRSFAISSHLFTSSLFDETFWNSDFDPSRRTINQKIQQQSKKEYQQSLQFSQQQPSVHLMTSLMCLIWLREHWCTLKHLGGFQTAGVLSDKTTWDPGTKTKGSASSATPIRKAFLSSIYSLSLYSPPHIPELGYWNFLRRFQLFTKASGWKTIELKGYQLGWQLPPPEELHGYYTKDTWASANPRLFMPHQGILRRLQFWRSYSKCYTLHPELSLPRNPWLRSNWKTFGFVYKRPHILWWTDSLKSIEQGATLQKSWRSFRKPCWCFTWWIPAPPLGSRHSEVKTQSLNQSGNLPKNRFFHPSHSFLILLRKPVPLIGRALAKTSRADSFPNVISHRQTHGKWHPSLFKWEAHFGAAFWSGKSSLTFLKQSFIGSSMEWEMIALSKIKTTGAWGILAWVVYC